MSAINQQVGIRAVFVRLADVHNQLEHRATVLSVFGQIDDQRICAIFAGDDEV